VFLSFYWTRQIALLLFRENNLKANS